MTSTTLPTPNAPSDGASIDAAPEGVPEHAALALAKLRLIETAQLIDPLKPIRDHPFMTVGVAGGTGAILGSTGGAAVALSGLVHSFATMLRSVTRLAVPLASVIGPIIAGKVAEKYGADEATEAPTSDASKSTVTA